MNEITQTAEHKVSRLSALRGYVVSKSFLRALVIALGSLSVIIAYMAATSPRRYDLSVGMVPTATIAATKDVIDEVATSQNRTLAAAAVTPTYTFKEGITDEVALNLDAVIAQMSAVRQYAQTLPEYSATRRYTEEELTYAADMVTLVEMRDYQLVTLMNTPQAQYDELLTALRAAVRNTMQGHVTQGQESIAVNSIMQIVGFKTNVSLLQNVALPIIKAVIVPNMVIDQVQTDAAKQTAMQAVEPVVFKQGQNIVVRGEGRIRANQIAMLNTLGLLNNNEIDYRMYVGAFLIMAAILAVTMVLLQLTAPQLMKRIRLLILIYLSLLIVTLLCLLAKVIHVQYLAPYLLSAFLITLTMGTMPGLILNAASASIAALVLGSSSTASVYDPLTVLLTGLIAGSAVTVILSRRGQKSLVMVAGGVATVLSFLSVLALILLTASGTSNLWEKPLYAAGGALLSTALCYAAQPLIESAFNLPTNNRLMELSNPNQPLLRRLLLEAPGTYHHSILIANMAEASAEAVGANPLLARVGGYYHDIGKLKRPLYFKENQIGTGNVHDSTDPAVSAAIITAHTRDGLALAKQYRLPLEVQEIVAQHHGNSRVKYFYTKAIKESGEAVDEEIFAYDGTPPQSPEAAIVMLCDTIEAAVRTLNNPTTEEIHSFIWKLIRGKIDDGQLANAPLTMKDLYSIQTTCANVVHGIFHERIEYPSDEKLSALERIRSNLKQASHSTEGSSSRP